MNLFEYGKSEELVLRDYQQKSVDAVRAAFMKSKSVVLQLPTGAGKSATSCFMIKEAIRRGVKCLFFADVKTLIDQTVTEFNRFGVEVGVQQGDHPLWNPHAMCQICTPQTIARRGLPKDFGFAVLDEIHHYHRVFDDVLSSGAFVLGMSATPWRKGLGKKFDTIVAPVSMTDLIEAGHLVNYEVFTPCYINMDGVGVVAGEFDQKETAKRADDSQITGDVVKNWLEHGENRKTIAFCHNIAHAKHMAREFQRAGVKAKDVNCHMRKAEEGDQVKVVMEQFKKNEIKVLVSVSMLTKGFDAVDVEALILAKPTKSYSLHVQMCGRGLRQYENSRDCLIFDHAGNMSRLGFPEDIIITTLDRGESKKKGERKEKEKEIPLPKECPSCHNLKPASVHKCPFCGAVMEHIQNVDVIEGRLKKVKRKKVDAKDYSLTEKQMWIGGLNSYAKSHKMKKSPKGFYYWARYKYKDKFGTDIPNKIDWAYQCGITQDVDNFITHVNIKYRAEKAKEQKAKFGGEVKIAEKPIAKKKYKEPQPCRNCGSKIYMQVACNNLHKHEIKCQLCGTHIKFGKLEEN